MGERLPKMLVSSAAAIRTRPDAMPARFRFVVATAIASDRSIPYTTPSVSFSEAANKRGSAAR